jgi:hypothetical protein
MEPIRALTLRLANGMASKRHQSNAGDPLKCRADVDRRDGRARVFETDFLSLNNAAPAPCAKLHARVGGAGPQR